MTRAWRRGVAAVGLIALAGVCASADPYDPPAGYYATATGTGATLKAQLFAIISKDYWTGGATRILSYTGQTRFAMAIGSRQTPSPTDAFQVLVYDGVLHTKVWNSGSTWNSEHTWPRSRGVGSSGPDDSDCHMLRPALTASNGSRGNNPYGTGAGEFDPNQGAGQHYRGEMARAMFYAATRYEGTESGTVDLELVNGTPSGNQMGDLAELLLWHFDEGPSARERWRNHVLWSNSPADWYDAQVNPSSTTYHQGNRNPFVDHPEYVWTIWGTGPNNATLYVGPGFAGDGSSAATVDLGRVIHGAAVETTVPLNKTGAHPSTWLVTTVTGAAYSDDEGLARTYPSVITPSIPQPLVSVGIDSSLGGFGLLSGTVVIDDTDLTSAGAGKGSADADDVITVELDAVDHSNASFESLADADGMVIDFGTVGQFASVAPVGASVWNLVSPNGATAGLDVDAVNGSGATAVVSIDLGTSSNLDAGQARDFFASVDTSAALGFYESTYTVSVSDENIPGATAQGALVVTVRATIAPACAGDINGDGMTNAADFTVMAGNFGAGPGMTRAQGDLTGDGFVNAADFTILAGDFGCQ